MKTYFWRYENKAKTRGLNRTITVYTQNKSKGFFYIGEREINTGSYMGDYAIVCQIINDVKGHRLTKCRYMLESKNIQLVEFPNN